MRLHVLSDFLSDDGVVPVIELEDCGTGSSCVALKRGRGIEAAGNHRGIGLGSVRYNEHR